MSVTIEKKELSDTNDNFNNWAYDHPAAADALLVLVIAHDSPETNTITGVTYDGVAMDVVRTDESVVSSSGGRKVGGVFLMQNAPSGSHNLELQHDGDLTSRGWHVYSLSAEEVIEVRATGATLDQIFNNTAVEVSVASEVGDLVLDHIGWRESATDVASIGTGQTQELADGTPTRQNGTSKPGEASSTTMEHTGDTSSSSNACLYYAVAIQGEVVNTEIRAQLSMDDLSGFTLPLTGLRYAVFTQPLVDQWGAPALQGNDGEINAAGEFVLDTTGEFDPDDLVYVYLTNSDGTVSELYHHGGPVLVTEVVE